MSTNVWLHSSVGRASHGSRRSPVRIPEHEAQVLGSIAELREREGSFTSRRLMERAGIRHVTDLTVRTHIVEQRRVLLPAGSQKGLMSEADKVKRVEFARKM